MRALIAALLTATPAMAGTIVGPSGVSYVLQETLFEPAGAYDAARRMVRLRFVAPKVSDEVLYGFAVIEADFQTLCDGEGVQTVEKFAPNAREIVISVSSQAVAFGESVPNVVQYFDSFKVEDNTCVWGGL